MLPSNYDTVQFVLHCFAANIDVLNVEGYIKKWIFWFETDAQQKWLNYLFNIVKKK